MHIQFRTILSLALASLSVGRVFGSKGRLN